MLKEPDFHVENRIVAFLFITDELQISYGLGSLNLFKLRSKVRVAVSGAVSCMSLAVVTGLEAVLNGAATRNDMIREANDI